MWTLIIFAVIAWFVFSHFKKKKYEAEAKKWNVDHRREPGVKKVQSRIKWKDLP
ncbi:hypothetical protein ACFOWX_05995 [Sphingorhabdus arenilitoris]|uniref:Uncharacterized protein n=1 Tax=Sphingorhabdus arenilitoris TaxID=1490041 RepID=A0ABV8RF07_9SPHN